MRKLVFLLVSLAFTMAVSAQSLRGISVKSFDSNIVVRLNGEQVCTDTQSCFIANLTRGRYLVEVFSADRYPSRDSFLMTRSVFYEGRGVLNIDVQGRDRRPGYHTPSYGRSKLMSARAFEFFFKDLKDEPFKSERMKMLTTALSSNDFTCAQCIRIMNLFSFDRERVDIIKMMYPRIVDKERIFSVIDELDFISSKDEVRAFIRHF